MLNCRKAKPLIAASVYDDLETGERTLLDEHLHDCAACRRDLAQLRTTMALIQTETPPLDEDLLPAIRRRMRLQEEGVEKTSWALLSPWAWGRIAAVGAICLLVVVGLAHTGLPGQGPATTVGPVASSLTLSPVEHAIEEADVLQRGRDFAGAFRVLNEAVAEHPEDAMAGEALRRCADLAFTELRWYPEADRAYERLCVEFPRVFTTDETGIARRDLLAEARGINYASLHDLDAARRASDDAFGRLEDVVAQYPTTFVASMAVNDMAEMAVQESGGGGDVYVAAMEKARSQCEHPIAVARIDLELGNLYRDQLHDRDRARTQYEKVIDSGNVLLAQLARDSLAGLPPSQEH